MRIPIPARCFHQVALCFGLASLGLFPPTALGQTYKVLKSFAPLAQDPSTGWYTNSDGAYPAADLIQSGQTLFGVTVSGGSLGSGSVFKINSDGSGFAVLHSFAAVATNAAGTFTNLDGQQPRGRLLLSGDVLFGTAEYGGEFGGGTLFRVTTNGEQFEVLKHFVLGGADGAYSSTGVDVPGGEMVYGTTTSGGKPGAGVIFRVGTTGNNFSVVHNFSYAATNGALPYGTLLRAGSVFYGTTYAGGASGYGTVYKMNTNGGDFTVLKSFPATVADANADGAQPQSRLVTSDGVLYGTTYAGGVSSNGVVFRLNTDGTAFTNLYSFSATTNRFGSSVNSDGAHPGSRLVLAGNTLYGTTEYGGNGAGTLFSINTDGSSFLRLRTFTSTDFNDGRVPSAGLVLSGAIFYGVTQYGGTNNAGTVFSYQWQPAPPITIARLGANIILSWPTNDFTFTLESTARLGASAAWSSLSPAPAIVNGRNTVTNPATGAAEFNRLSPY